MMHEGSVGNGNDRFRIWEVPACSTAPPSYVAHNCSHPWWTGALAASRMSLMLSLEAPREGHRRYTKGTAGLGGIVK